MKKSIVILLLSLFFNALLAQSISKVGTSAAKFLDVPIDARGTGMGQAAVVGFNDPSTLFWNPSTIAYIENISAHFSYTQWYEQINFNYLVAIFPQGHSGAIGINIVYFQTEPMEVTTERFQEGTGEFFSVGSYAFGLAYARKLTSNFAIGANLKYILEKIYHSTAQGLAFDIGVRYSPPWKGFRIGFAISNFGTKMQLTGDDLLTSVDIDPTQSGNNDVINSHLATDKFELPLNLALGIAWDAIKTSGMRMTIEADGLHPSDNFESMNIGSEIAFLNETVYLRTGYAHLFLESIEPNFSIGGGVRYPITGNMHLSFDYSYQTHSYLDRNQHVSMTLMF